MDPYYYCDRCGAYHPSGWGKIGLCVPCQEIVAQQEQEAAYQQAENNRRWQEHWAQEAAIEKRKREEEALIQKMNQDRLEREFQERWSKMTPEEQREWTEAKAKKDEENRKRYKEICKKRNIGYGKRIESNNWLVCLILLIDIVILVAALIWGGIILWIVYFLFTVFGCLKIKDINEDTDFLNQMISND